MRIVLDTNVVLSALLWRGPPFQLLKAIRENPSTHLYTSPVLLQELAEVLARPAASRRLAAIGTTAGDVLIDYLEAVDLVEPAEIPRVVRDPDDDHVLACALAANTEWIVSGDRDLLDIGTFQGIRNSVRSCRAGISHRPGDVKPSQI